MWPADTADKEVADLGHGGIRGIQGGDPNRQPHVISLWKGSPYQETAEHGVEETAKAVLMV